MAATTKAATAKKKLVGRLEYPRRWPFPLPPLTLGPEEHGETGNQAQVIFRPTRLSIAETVGPSALTDIRIGSLTHGGNSQLVNLGGVIPVTLYARCPCGGQADDDEEGLVSFDQANVGAVIRLSFVNHGSKPTTLLAALLGITPRYV